MDDENESNARRRDRSRSPRKDRSRSPRRDNRGGDRYGSYGGDRGGGDRGGSYGGKGGKSGKGGGKGGKGSGRGITCYGCQQTGHHIRDCPTANTERGKGRVSAGGFSNKFNRTAGQKRGREDDAPQQDEDEDDEVETRLKSLFVRIGDKGSAGLERNIDLLATAMEEDVLAHHKFIIEILYKCVLAFPAKAPVYSTLIGLMNEANNQFGLDCVKQGQISLFKALQDNDHDQARFLVRFLGCLVNAHVIKPASFLVLLTDLFKCVDEEKLNGNTADLVVYDVIFCLPWVGEVLSTTVNDDFTTLMNSIDNHMESRCDTLNPMTSITTKTHSSIRCDDLLYAYWSGVNQCQANKWVSPSILTPHKHFTDRLTSTTEHKFEMDIVPSQGVTVPYQLRTVLRVYDLSLGIGKDITDIDRLITSDYISDTLLTFAAINTDGTKQLLALPVEFDYFHLVVETVLSLAFQLPTTREKIVYYFGIFVNMFKAEPKKVPPLVGRAIHGLFMSIDVLDCEIRDRFSQWFSFHLSNFGFQWPWKNWAFVLNQPAESPQRVFLHDSLSRCVRLSFWEKIKETLPENVLPLMTLQPIPNFKYASAIEGDDNHSVKVELSNQLMTLLREKKPSDELLEWFEANVTTKLGENEKLDIFIPTLLMAGSKTFSHIFALIERYATVFSKLGANTPQNQAKIVSLVGDFWSNSPQHAIIVLDRLGTSRVVNPPCTIGWCFKQTNDLFRPWLWELLGLVVDKTLISVNTIMEKLEEKVVSVGETEAEPLKQKVATLSKQKKDMFVMIFKNFHQAISEAGQKSNRDLVVELKQRLKQFQRKFDSCLVKIAEDIKKEAFIGKDGEQAEEILDLFNATHSQLLSLKHDH